MKYARPEVSDFGSITANTFGLVASSMRGLGYGEFSGGTGGPSSDDRHDDD